MGIDQNLFDKLQRYDLLDSEKLLWVDFRLKQTDPDGFFHFKCRDWLHAANHSRRTLYRRLKNLENQSLIIREARPQTLDSPYTTNGAGGKFSFIKALDPETENDMTFFGKFDFIETKSLSASTVIKTAIFRDVYNIPDTINLSYAFCDLEENCPKSIALENMERGDSVVFKGCVRRNIKGRACIVNIWNIRPAEAFYADRGN